MRRLEKRIIISNWNKLFLICSRVDKYYALALGTHPFPTLCKGSTSVSNNSLVKSLCLMDSARQSAPSRTRNLNSTFQTTTKKQSKLWSDKKYHMLSGQIRTKMFLTLVELYFLRTNFALRFSPLYKYKTPVFISIFSRGSCVATKSAADDLGLVHLPFLLFRLGCRNALALLLACCLSSGSDSFDCASIFRCFVSERSCCADSWIPQRLLQRLSSSTTADCACEPKSLCLTSFRFICSLLLKSGLCRLFSVGCFSFLVSKASASFEEEQSEDDVELDTIESVANICDDVFACVVSEQN